MNIGTIIVLVILAVIVFFAVRSIYKQKKNGSCCSGDCSKCHGCSSTKNTNNKK